MIMKIRRTSDRPEPRFQSYATMNSCSMTLPMSRIFPPPRSEETTKVVRAGMKTIVMPEMTPGMESGKVTRTKVCPELAPRSLAALMTFQSISFSAL